jgi:ABC-type dipeptide/oligopeptide/nickel transport system permease subunit
MSRSLLRRRPAAVIGLAVLSSILILVIAGPLVWPYGPLSMDAKSALLGPSWPHLLGTDNFGRDLLSRTLQGGRVSLAVSLAAVLVASLIGFWLGVISGYFRGWIDLVLQRLVDALLAVPSLLLAIALVAVLGNSLWNVVIAIAAIFVGRVARVARASTLAVREMDYIEAARAIGVAPGRILVNDVARNVLGPTIAIATVSLPEAILVEATMSFLGLGVALPDPSWGNMLTGDARTHFFRAPHLVLVPGLALAITVFAVNLVGDVLSDLNNPRLRQD